MFSKEERSTFPYWFAHWCAFQMTALNLRAWRFKYVFHDAEKPWLRLFLPYSKVQRLHRIHNRHHIGWLEHNLKKNHTKENIERLLSKFDFDATIIDWECCHFTKIECPLDALGEHNRVFNDNFEDKYPCITKYCYSEFFTGLMNSIKKFGLNNKNI